MRPPLAPSRPGGSNGAGPSGSGAQHTHTPQQQHQSWAELAGRALAGAALGLAGVSLALRLLGGVGPGGGGSLLSASTCAAPPAAWHLRSLDWGDGTADGDAAGRARVCAPAPPGAVNAAGGRHGGACGAAVGVPKAALLFLTKGAMPHDAMWAAWLEAAAGLVPADCAAAAGCADGGALPRLRAECAAAAAAAPGGDGKAPPPDPLYRQGLFSVYVHVPKGGSLDSPAPGTPFTARTLIAGRVATEWGGFTLAAATKALMRAALADPANQRFALLSEACVPLYSPQTVYAQLMYNPASRINACPDGSKPDWPLDHYRYTWRMEGATGGALTQDKWRKSHQWVGLTRRHARAVADDTEVAAAFEKHCTNAMDPDRGVWRSCFSDEHYFATLLALKGWGEGPGPTDCEGDMTHTVWCRGAGCEGDAKLHPKHYNASEAGAGTLLALRRGGAAPGADCRDAAAAAAAGGLLVPADRVGGRRGGGGGGPAAACAAAGPALMPGRCSLFARKFNGDVVGEVRAAVQAVTALDGRAQCAAAAG